MNRNPRIGQTFSKLEQKRKEALLERNRAYRSAEGQAAYDQERMNRIAEFQRKNGFLPTKSVDSVSSEFPRGDNAPAMGFSRAVKETVIPTKVEKPYRRTVFKYKPLSV